MKTMKSKSSAPKRNSIIRAPTNLKVIKPSVPIGSLASYQFECELHEDFLNNLAVQVGLSDSLKVTDITDDLKLESFFLQQALASVVSGRDRLESCGRIFTRPSTYHAHMLKTVAHLQKIQRVEAEEKKGREASMDAKRQRLLKATAKKVQQDTLQERQKARSEDRKKLEVIKKKSGEVENAGDSSDNDNENDKFNVETVVEDIISGKGKGKKVSPPLGKKNFNQKQNSTSDSSSSSSLKPHSKTPHLPNSKRQSKDKKYGFGGANNKLKKRNTKESVNDLSGFSKANTKTLFGGASVGKARKGSAPNGKNSKNNNRPGKARRQQNRGRAGNRK